MSNDEFKGGHFTWFTGVVEDVKDPLQHNRVKVRCFGFYSSEIAVEDLPWATVMMPTTTASIQGNGANHQLENGSWVVGFFRDGKSAQDPLIMGSIATQTDGIIDAPGDNFITPEEGETEGTVDYDDKYIKTKAGHRIRFNNSPGKERVEILHGVNNSKVSLDEHGGVEMESSTGQKIALRDNNGNGSYISISAASNSPIYLSTTDADINLSTLGTGNVRISGSKIMMNSAKSVAEYSKTQDAPDWNAAQDPYEPDQDTKDAIIEFLGEDFNISPNDYNYLIRTVAAEASPRNQKERAAVAGVILNRVRSPRYKANTIVGVVTQVSTSRGRYIPQFSGVGGTYVNKGPTQQFTGMKGSTGDAISSAIKSNLSSVNKTWLNFSAVSDKAYLKKGEQNIAFREAIRSSGGEIIGETIFGTVRNRDDIGRIGGQTA